MAKEPPPYMPTDPEKSGVTVELDDPNPKVGSVRFNEVQPESGLASVYVGRDLLKVIGNPTAIKVTIEPA